LALPLPLSCLPNGLGFASPFGSWPVLFWPACPLLELHIKCTRYGAEQGDPIETGPSIQEKTFNLYPFLQEISTFSFGKIFYFFKITLYYYSMVNIKYFLITILSKP